MSKRVENLTRLDLITFALILGEPKMGWMTAKEMNVVSGDGDAMRHKLAQSLVEQAVMIEKALTERERQQALNK